MFHLRNATPSNKHTYAQCCYSVTSYSISENTLSPFILHRVWKSHKNWAKPPAPKFLKSPKNTHFLSDLHWRDFSIYIRVLRGNFFKTSHMPKRTFTFWAVGGDWDPLKEIWFWQIKVYPMLSSFPLTNPETGSPEAYDTWYAEVPDFWSQNLGIFWGAPRTPHPRFDHTQKLWQVQLKLSRDQIFSSTSGLAQNGPQTYWLRGFPLKI